MESRRKRMEKLAEGEREKVIAGVIEQRKSVGVGLKRGRPNSNSPFNFDWDYANEDTSYGNSIHLYQKPLYSFSQTKLQLQHPSMHADHHSQTNNNDDDVVEWAKHVKLSYKAPPGVVFTRTNNWEETGFNKKLLYAMHRAGYPRPTPLQMALIPLALQRRDHVCLSNSGSGKTAAFLLSMLHSMSNLPLLRHRQNSPDLGPYALVLAPSYDRVVEIQKEALKFAFALGVEVSTLDVVGMSISFKARMGCELLISTPSLVNICLEKRDVVLHQCGYVVLDKVDHMVGIGYERSIGSVLDAMGLGNVEGEVDEDSQNEAMYPTVCVFSATMEEGVERISNKYLRNPVVLTFGNPERGIDRVVQDVVMMEELEKVCRLLKLLEEHGDKKTIVFANTAIQVLLLYEDTMNAGYNARILIGPSPQDNEFTVQALMNWDEGVLIATDVDVLGLDTQDIVHVINYDMPRNIATYMSRLERTGRWGKPGLATTFLTLNDANVFYDLKQYLIQTNSHVPAELDTHPASY